MEKGKSIFLSLRKAKYDHVLHKSNTPYKVLGKGKGSLADENTNATNVSLDEGLKHNILSMS